MKIIDCFDIEKLNFLKQFYTDIDIQTIAHRLILLARDTLEGKDNTGLTIDYIISHLDTLREMSVLANDSKLYFELKEKILTLIKDVLDDGMKV